MKLDKRCKLYLVCEKEKSRYSLNGAQLDPKEETLAATNGHILAVVKVEDTDGDSEGTVPASLLKAAVGGKSLPDPMLSVGDDCTAFLRNGESLKAEKVEGSFPEWKKVVPETWSMELSLDVSLLWDLVRAIGAETVTLQFSDPSKCEPVRVKPIKDCANPANFGVIMPISKE